MATRAKNVTFDSRRFKRAPSEADAEAKAKDPKS